MLHVITLYSIAPEAVGAFVCSIRRGGQWQALARSLAPDLIATDLLEHQTSAMPPFVSTSSTLFVCIDFWASAEAYRRSCRQPGFQALLLARRRMAGSAFELGAFSSPGPEGAETQASPAAALN